jgi:heptosyltransferase-2
VAADKEKIAVVLPNHLGDAVMATPALRSLRSGFPHAHIVGVIREELEPVLRGAPWLDRILTHTVYRVRGRVARLRRRLAMAQALQDRDTVILLPNSFVSALVAYASGAECRVGYGRRARRFLLTDPVEPPRERGRFVPVAMERYYLDLVLQLGCPDLGTEVELFLELAAERERETRFRASGIDRRSPLACIAPGAAFGPSKLWPMPYFAEVARALLDDGVQVALVHAPGEEPLANEIRSRAGAGVVSLGGAGMNLSLLKSVIARSQLLICNDAGARHVAAAFGIPCLTLVGPTSIRYTNLNLKRTKLLREAVPCSPCQLPTCPIDHRCMTRLLPARVIAEARAALADDGWRGDLHLELAQ